MNLTETLRDAKIVIFWNWRLDLDQMRHARKVYSPERQTWIALNRDDPHSLFIISDMHSRKNMFQIVFSSGTAALPSYMIAGALEAHAFVPAVDSSHYHDPIKEYETDVAFIGTQPYSQKGSPRNRTRILQELVKNADKTGMKLAIYGTESLGAAFPKYYKGPISYEENRKVWSNAKISLNLHVVDGFGGWYANARNTEILGSKGLLLVDKAVEGVFQDGEECIFLKSNKPEEIVSQIHEILENYGRCERIREKGYHLAHTVFSSQQLALRMLESISRVRLK